MDSLPREVLRSGPWAADRQPQEAGLHNPLAGGCRAAESGLLAHPDDIKQPLDHLPPREERDKAIEIEEPSYPTADEPTARPHASPETAAEPEKPNRHGAEKLPPAQA